MIFRRRSRAKPISIHEGRKTETTKTNQLTIMKTTTTKLVILAAFVAVLLTTGCAGPAVRHDNRVDRRHDTAERVDDRATNRQDNRYDRRGDRYDRRDARYGY